MSGLSRASKSVLNITSRRGVVVKWNDNTYYYKPCTCRLKPVTASSLFGHVNCVRHLSYVWKPNVAYRTTRELPKRFYIILVRNITAHLQYNFQSTIIRILIKQGKILLEFLNLFVADPRGSIQNNQRTFHFTFEVALFRFFFLF